MSVHTSQDTATLVAGLYLGESEPSMRRVLEASGATSDHEIADAIEADARERLNHSLPTPLARYLDAIPALPGLRIALDAALEFVIRSAVRAGSSEADTARALARAHPTLAEAIETTFALADGLTTTTIIGRSAGRTAPLAVPCDFGPRTPDGRPRYDVRERLGMGAQGEVYLAADRQLSEPDKPAWVAIKRLRQVVQPDAATHAAAEAHKSRRISHTNVVRVFDRATDESGMDYIVYEFVNDGDLAQWFSKRTAPLPPRRAAALVSQIARGVHAAHLAGVVHCDLKPSNILLTSDGVPKVADFGVAAAVRSEAARLPDATPVGNLAFTSPEQFRADDGAQAIPADVYGLGGLLYFLLTGKSPNGATPAQVAARHTHPGTPAPSPRALRPDVDSDLDAICRRALAPQSADRHASAHALAEDLESWLAARPIEWRRPRQARRIALLFRRQPSLVLASLLTVAALVAGAATTVYFAMRGQQQVLAERFLATQDRQRQHAKSMVELQERLISTLKVIRFQTRGGVSLDWFPPLTILESAAGPLLFAEGARDEAADVWTGRIMKVQDVLAQAESSGRGLDFENVLWRDAVAFWALRAGDHAGARTALLANDAYWDSRLAPGDSWRTMRSGMHACEVVQRHAAAAATVIAPPPTVSTEEVSRAAHNLRAAIETLDADTHRRSMRILFLIHLRAACAPELLDRPEESAEIRRRLVQTENVGEDDVGQDPAPTR